MKLEIDISQNFRDWLKDAKYAANKLIPDHFNKFFRENIFYYEHYMHEGNDGLFVSIFNIGIYLSYV